MSEDGEGRQESGNGLPGLAKWLPLNSRRLTKVHLRLIAESLELSPGLSKEELRQQIEGKLSDLEHEPGHVQVAVQETAKTEIQLSLEDESGVFHICGPTTLSCQRPSREFEEDEMEQLRECMQEEVDLLRRMCDEQHRHAEQAEANSARSCRVARKRRWHNLRAPWRLRSRE